MQYIQIRTIHTIFSIHSNTSQYVQIHAIHIINTNAYQYRSVLYKYITIQTIQVETNTYQETNTYNMYRESFHTIHANTGQYIPYIPIYTINPI